MNRLLLNSIILFILSAPFVIVAFVALDAKRYPERPPYFVKEGIVYNETNVATVTNIVWMTNAAKVQGLDEHEFFMWDDGAYWASFAFVFMGAQNIAEGKSMGWQMKHAGTNGFYWTNIDGRLLVKVK